jgi:hypothetical protein
MDAPSVSQKRVTDLLVRWSDGDDAALAELVPLVSAPIRSQLDKRLLEIDVGYLNFAPRCKKNCSAAHEQGLLSRRPEGEEFRASEAGGKNAQEASVRGVLQDIAVRNRICLGYKEIARAVKGQATRKS